MQYIISCVAAFLCTTILMPLIMKIAIKFGFTDKPTKRKQHKKPIPLCGGVAIYISFFIFYFIFVKDVYEKKWVFIASTLVFLIGLIDDYYKTRGKEFPIYPRLIIQVFAAYLIFKSGIAFEGFMNPFTGVYVYLPYWIQCILTILWMFGVTTVINWSDGMDGLAGGISTVSSVTFFIAALILGQDQSEFFAIILVGSLVGFLVYNRHPAKVFMGDSGANLVGFLLSILAIDGAFKQATVFSLFIPILTLAVPIFDNIFVIYKRYREGKPVYQADRSQIHYRLEKRGFTTNQTVSFIITISVICSTISIILLLIRH